MKTYSSLAPVLLILSLALPTRAVASQSPHHFADFTATFLLEEPTQLIERPAHEWESVLSLCTEMGWLEREFDLRRARFESGGFSDQSGSRGDRERLGELAALIGNEREALRYLDYRGSDDPEILAAAGLLSLRLGRLDEGTALLERAIEQGAPDEDLLRYRLGQALKGSGNGEKGLAILIDLGRGTSRHRTGALHSAATYLFSDGEEEKAFQLLQDRYGKTFTKLTNRELLHRIADHAQHKEDIELASRLWKRILERWPEDSRAMDAFRSLRRLEETGLIDNDPRLALAGARAARANERYEEAVHLLRPYLDRPESDALHQEALLETGRILYLTERYNAALESFARLADTGGGLVRTALLYRARSYKKMGEWESAIREYGEYVKRFPGSSLAPEVQWEISWRRKIVGQYADAAESFRRLRTRFPGSDYARKAPLQEGLCMDLAGDTPGGLAVLRKLVESGQAGRDRDDALFWIGDMSEKLGDIESAEAAYTLLIEDYPETYYGLRAAGRMGKTVILAPSDFDWGPPGGDPALQWLHSWAATKGDREPDSSLVHYYASIGEMSQARREAGRLLERHGKEASTLLELGRFYRRLGLADYTIRAGRRLQDLAEARGADDVHPFLLTLIYPIGYFDLVILETAKRRDVDPFFVMGIMRQESWFRSDAMSSAGARGLLQIIPRTGRHLARLSGEENSFQTANLLEPARNIRYGILYIRNLKKRYDGNLSIVASAYNAGEANADIWRARNVDFPDEEYVELINYSETRNYVKRTLSGYWIYRSLYRDLAASVPVG